MSFFLQLTLNYQEGNYTNNDIIIMNINKVEHLEDFLKIKEKKDKQKASV